MESKLGLEFRGVGFRVKVSVGVKTSVRVSVRVDPKVVQRLWSATS